MVFMDVLNNSNVFKEGPLCAPVWYATQVFPFLSYFLKQLFVGLSTNIAEYSN